MMLWRQSRAVKPAACCLISTRNTFISSSPRWLIIFTAMQPLAGLGNGREMSLWSVAQASASVLALSVVWRRFFVVAGQAREARGEGVGDGEIHALNKTTSLVAATSCRAFSFCCAFSSCVLEPGPAPDQCVACGRLVRIHAKVGVADRATLDDRRSM